MALIFRQHHVRKIYLDTLAEVALATQNVLAIVDFDMRFIYASAG
jgi:hypothetical protein